MPTALLTGLVEPSTLAPFVEQVGWGVGRQVVRRLHADGVEVGVLLDELPDRAEAPGWAAYAVLEGRTAVAVALVHLAGERATYVGDVVAPTAPPGTREALLVRALHDAGAAGADVLQVTQPGVGLAGWPHANDR
ncbi:hypothetical protein [Nocardioides marmoraquaticus]